MYVTVVTWFALLPFVWHGNGVFQPNCTGCAFPNIDGIQESMSPTDLGEGTRIITYRDHEVLICPQFSCVGRCNQPVANLTQANCFCDDVCLFYGDCCFDAKAVCNVSQTWRHDVSWLNNQQPRCCNIFESQYALMIDRCDDNWIEDSVKELCEGEVLDRDSADRVLPVTHQNLNITFKNTFCAQCNFVDESAFEFWGFSLNCQIPVDLHRVQETTLSTLRSLHGGDCQVTPKPPHGFSYVRYCNPSFRNTCRSDSETFESYNMTSEDSIEIACAQYAAYVVLETVGGNRKTAKNTHCTLCADNDTHAQGLACPSDDDLHLELSLMPFQIVRGILPFSYLLDFNGFHREISNDEAEMEICYNNTVYINGECREAMCKEEFHREEDFCVPNTDDPDVVIELTINKGSSDVGTFKQVILNQAHDHGVDIEKIIPDINAPGNDVICGESISALGSSSLADFDIGIDEAETTLSDLLEYVDDLIQNNGFDLAYAQVSKHGVEECTVLEPYSLVTDANQNVYFRSQEGNWHSEKNVSWEITWVRECVNGRYWSTTNKTVQGCVKEQHSCLFVATSETELDKIKRTMTDALNDSTLIMINGSQYVCSSILRDLTKDSLGYKSDDQSAESILTAVLLPVSILSLILTILIHIAIPRLRSLPGRIVLSLCLALLFAQVLFLTIESARSVPWLCKTIAMAEHFLWLSTFSWSNILALDLEITLTQSTKVGNNRNTRVAFLQYSAFGWGFPVAIVIVVALVSQFTQLPVTYGDSSLCWLLYQDALLFAFALPVAIAVVANTWLLSRAIYFVWKVSKLVKNANIVQDQKVKGFLCVKLAFLMGLTWTFGILGTLFHSEPLMYLFTIFNCLQGVYIFVAFVCNKRVFRYCRNIVVKRLERFHSSASHISRSTTESKMSSH